MRKERDGEREENGLCIFSGSADGDHLMNKIKEYSVKLLYIYQGSGRGEDVRSCVARSPAIQKSILDLRKSFFFSFLSFFEENRSKWRFTISQLVKIFFFLFLFKSKAQSTVRQNIGRVLVEETF